MLNRDMENSMGKNVGKKKLIVHHRTWNNFKNTKIYVDGIQQDLRDRRTEKKNLITGWKFSRYDKSFKPINTEAQLTQG